MKTCFFLFSKKGINNESKIGIFTVVKAHFSKEVEGLDNSTSEIFIVLMKKVFGLVVELGKVLSVLLVENQN